MKSNIFITLKKELRSMFRDKKTLVRLVAIPLMIPIFIYLYSYMFDNSGLKTYNVGINYKINDVEKIIVGDSSLRLKEYDTVKELENAYKEKKISAYIVLDTANNSYNIYVNSESEEGMSALQYANSYLAKYNEYLTKNYLVERGINVDEAYDQIKIGSTVLEGENFFLKLVYSMALTYVIMSIVIATTNMATSATAVEKENGTLETILTFPIKSKDLIIGKYLATLILGIIASLISLALTIGSLSIAKETFEIFKTINYSIDVFTILISILVTIFASALISGLSLALTCSAKTFKEAQSASQILSLVTTIPLFVSLVGVKVSLSYYFIPIANYIQVLMDIFAQNVNYTNILIVLLSSLIFTLILIKYIIEQYKSEKILFH